MIGHRVFGSEPIGNLFYLHAVIFEGSTIYTDYFEMIVHNCNK